MEVSVIVPVYNSEKYLRKCLDSIINQTFADFECILVDDDSCDGSYGICMEYAAADARVRVIRNERNLGVSMSRRAGLELSTGKYILYVDSDDWMEPDMTERMYEKAVSADYDIVICDFFWEKAGDTKVWRQDLRECGKEALIRRILSIRVKAVLWNKLVKRELYVAAEFPVHNRAEDYVVTVQNIYNSTKIGFLPVPLYHYVFYEQSLSNNREAAAAGRVGENRNWKILVRFLKEGYGENLKIFEPELSNHINDFKIIYRSNESLRSNKELFELYPESENGLRLVRRRLYKAAERVYKFIKGQFQSGRG